MRNVPGLRRLAACAALCMLPFGPAGCGGPGTDAGPRLSTRPDALRVFDYVAVDGARLGSATTRGRVTVLAFITTFDIASQVLVRRLSDLVHEETPRINVGAICLEPPKNAPLAQAFAASLEVSFPVALADQATLESRGPFGPVPSVPTVVVLDARGFEVFRGTGVPSVGELQSVVAEARRNASP